MDTRTRIIKGYASGFLFLRFVQIPKNEYDLERSIELLFETYKNSVTDNDTLKIKTNKLLNLLSMHDFLDRLDNKMAYSAIKNCLERWITLMEEEETLFLYDFSQKQA